MNELRNAANELEALRKIVELAEDCFEHEGESRESPEMVLREALRTAREDFATLAAAYPHWQDLDKSVFYRMEKRVTLALALGEYRARFGFVESTAPAASPPAGDGS